MNEKKKEKRFEKENIDFLVYDPTDSKFVKLLKEYVLVTILDFLPIYLLFLWVNLHNFFKFDFVLFLIGFEILGVLTIYWIYLVFVKYYLIMVNRYQIHIKNLGKPFKFVFFSDLHVGKDYYGTNNLRLKKIISKINKLDLDLVVIGGDFICEKIEEEMLLELRNIKAKHKLAVTGNHDIEYLKEEKTLLEPEDFIRVITKCGFKVLQNEGELLEIDGQKVFIGGIPDLYSKQFDLNIAFEKAPKGVPKVLLSHNPDIIDFVEHKDEIDLILSGHTHSGMIYWKPFGALFPMPTKYRWLTRGIFKLANVTQLFLSQGIGFSHTRLRIGTEAEICEIELQVDR